MTIFFIASLCESVIGSIALATKVVKCLVSSSDIYLQYEPSGSMMVFVFYGIWHIEAKEDHDKKYFF